MDVGVPIIRMQGQGIAVLRGKLGLRKIPNGRHEVGRRSTRWHRKDDFVDQLGGLRPRHEAPETVIATYDLIQLEAPVIDQLRDRLCTDDWRVKEIGLERSMVAVLQIAQMLADGFEVVASGTNDFDNDLWRSRAASVPGLLRLSRHRPGPVGVLESVTRSCWGLRSKGLLAPDGDDDIGDCAQQSAND